MTDDFRWIDAPQGRLYAQRWPRPADGAATPPAPILMLHDSLGCVALWREFPAELARATGRDVIAYDRAGFG
ncbi:alpha/beta hydrolase, partial [Burkholderia sp. Tr-860]|nr:alpha/beta hydrolase [Burkholderia sp. Tr-860]